MPKAKHRNAIIPFCHLERRPREVEVERSGFNFDFSLVRRQISPLRAALGSPSVEMTKCHLGLLDAACYPAGCG